MPFSPVTPGKGQFPRLENGCKPHACLIGAEGTAVQTCARGSEALGTRPDTTDSSSLAGVEPAQMLQVTLWSQGPALTS